MSTPGWKAFYPNQEGSRGSGSHRVLFEVAAAERQDAQRKSNLKQTTATPAKYLSRMSVKAGDRIVLIPLRDVVWMQSHGNRLRLHLQNASYEHRMTIKDMCSRLDPEHFLRVHRTAIVNLEHVVEFQLPRSGKALVHLSNGEVLPVSRPARTALKRGLLSQAYTSADTDDIQRA